MTRSISSTPMAPIRSCILRRVQWHLRVKHDFMTKTSREARLNKFLLSTNFGVDRRFQIEQWTNDFRWRVFRIVTMLKIASGKLFERVFRHGLIKRTFRFPFDDSSFLTKECLFWFLQLKSKIKHSVLPVQSFRRNRKVRYSCDQIWIVPLELYWYRHVVDLEFLLRDWPNVRRTKLEPFLELFLGPTRQLTRVLLRREAFRIPLISTPEIEEISVFSLFIDENEKRYFSLLEFVLDERRATTNIEELCFEEFRSLLDDFSNFFEPKSRDTNS